MNEADRKKAQQISSQLSKYGKAPKPVKKQDPVSYIQKLLAKKKYIKPIVTKQIVKVVEKPVYMGEPGKQGEKGDTGEQGIQGERGRAGSNGVDGKDGENALTETPKTIAKKLNTLEGAVDAKVIKNLPQFDPTSLKIGGANQLELRDIKGAKLNTADQRWHGGGDTVTAGANISITTNASGQKVITGTGSGGGTVTSVATAGLITGGPITSTGTITTSIATNSLVGRGTAGTGIFETISLGTNLSLSGTTLNASGGGGTPGGSNTQVQYNDSNSFGGSSKFTFDKNEAGGLIRLGLENTYGRFTSANASTPNTIGGSLIFYAGDGNGSGDGGFAELDGGTAGATGNGGAVYIDGGSGGATSGDGGSINLAAGSASGGNSNGGGISLVTGAGIGTGISGQLYLQTGDGADATKTQIIFIQAGDNFINDRGISFGGSQGNLFFDTSLLASSDKTFTFPNQSGIFATVTSGVGAPGSTPAAVGQIYTDTSGGKVYISTGTTNSGDWKILN